MLAAAFRGDLTKTWREQNPDVEPASALLERIRAERKARFIAAAGDKAEAKARAKALDAGKPWTEADAAKAVEKARAKAEAKYVEPEPVDEEGLPEGWCWVTLEHLAWDSGYGTSQKCSYDGEGPAVLRIPNIAKETLVLDDIKYSVSNYALSDAERVQTGDFLIVRTNGSRDLIGRAAHLDSDPSEQLDFASYLIRYRLCGRGLGSWVSHIWSSTYIRRALELLAATSAGQYNVSLSKLSTVRLPLPPEREAIEAVKLLEEYLSQYHDVLDALGQAQPQLRTLKQSILAKAFRGELVPQDPNDEPASVLLERIRAERAAAEPAKKTRRRKKKTAKAKAEQPKPAAKPKPTPPEPAPPGLNAPTRKASQLSILEPPPEPPKPGPALVDEAGEVMLHLRAHLRGRGAVPREEVVRALACELGYKRVGHVIRRRLDGHLLAAVRRGVLERGGGEEVRLATRRLEDYERDELVTALRSVSRRGGVYEREALSRAVLAHLGFRRLTQGAKEALRSAFNAAVRRKVFERVDASRVRRLD